MAALKRILPSAIAIAVSVFVLASVFLDIPILDAIGTYFVDIAIIIAAFALFLGLLNVLRVHARKIRERRSGAVYSLVLLVALLVVLVVGLPPFPNQASGPAHPVVQWIFEYIQTPIQATLSALLVFFIVTATYRLFRMRNLESIAIVVVALIVLVGQVTVGLVPILGGLRNWILDVPAMAGVRGILLGVALGALLTGIRLLLGVERPYSD